MRRYGLAGELRRRIAEGDMELTAKAALSAIRATDGYWEEAWEAVLGELTRLGPAERRRLVDVLVEGFHERGQDPDRRTDSLTLVSALSWDFPDDPLTAERFAELAELGRVNHYYWYGARLDLLAKAEITRGRALAPAVVAFFRRSALTGYEPHPAPEGTDRPVLNVGEEWAERAMADATGPDWEALLAHLTTATASRPTATWDKRARTLADTLGEDHVRVTALRWLTLVGRPRTFPLECGPHDPDINSALDPYNANALRGLAWLLSLLPPRPDTARALGALVETSLKRIAGLGARNPKVANAGVVALSRIDGDEALAQLARLSTRMTHKNTAKLLDTALRTRATALGLSREEIEELAVPAYGLTEVGRSTHHLGEVTAELTTKGTRTHLTWKNAAGKPTRTVPASVRRDHADDLKDLKAAAKDIDKMLTAQSERLDRQFLARRTWSYETWRERYLDHPLVGTLARRLLWTVDGTPTGFAEGDLRTLTDTPVTTGTEVTLWHPVDRDPAEVMAWRDWLEHHEITQPFKQAHRELYLLTDAERTTSTYSNRFAAHVVRQHQFNSLAAIRGWRHKLRLCFDDDAPPAIRELPEWGLRAEFWIAGDGEEYDVDTTESGTYLRLRTDQVRFYPLGAPADPLPLTTIPPLVLSEVLRDIDLFVGVASIGNDPTWQDGGPDGRFREYWTSYGFGDLTQSAQTRRTLLERLIPRLAIADRCTLEGRFLHVRGERHTYRIHLGSGNILMSPGDRYLCIVPKTNPEPHQHGYLPFEGDRMLAVILSKAMLLADDARITDQSILSQL
ncbi:DUF4132 domain-containing protein [Streptomyces adonidis]|uniref:DUF4132 domain-containing protein n=1 Tax=Streptomyces adonidis TaxID=3231367 RepID=UPI0034DB4B4B